LECALENCQCLDTRTPITSAFDIYTKINHIMHSSTPSRSIDAVTSCMARMIDAGQVLDAGSINGSNKRLFIAYWWSSSGSEKVTIYARYRSYVVAHASTVWRPVCNLHNLLHHRHSMSGLFTVSCNVVIYLRFPTELYITIREPSFWLDSWQVRTLLQHSLYSRSVMCDMSLESQLST